MHVSFTQPNTRERHACHKNPIFDILISIGGQPDLRSRFGKASALILFNIKLCQVFVYFNFPRFACQHILFNYKTPNLHVKDSIRLNYYMHASETHIRT